MNPRIFEQIQNIRMFGDNIRPSQTKKRQSYFFRILFGKLFQPIINPKSKDIIVKLYEPGAWPPFFDIFQFRAYSVHGVTVIQPAFSLINFIESAIETISAFERATPAGHNRSSWRKFYEIGVFVK